ncbi:VOC family protein [Actinoalloteichus caeruleus]|uniref:VOC family protein n=1 Tax=Actinoalloteichus cyanogriseus TaxID=2893586 RepID=UPI0004AAEC35|nr:VOC family protein [Actinoalloteichus caeruleus]
MGDARGYGQGTPCWADYWARDRRAAMDFYGAVLGWDFDEGPPETGYYTTASVGGKVAAGLFQPPEPDSPVTWGVYLASDDVDATARAVTEAGGHVVMGPTDVMEEGRMLLATDPTGAVFGAWQAGRHRGFQLVDQPGAVAWTELATRDAETARAFYARVFGVGISPPMAADFDYTTIRVDGRDVAGVWGAGSDEPDAALGWGTVFAVPGTDDALDVVTGRGGVVVRAAEDSPYGRLATCQDPQGGRFSLVGPNSEG